MANLVSNLNGLNLYVNPLLDVSNDGQIIRAVNVDSSPYGAKDKRQGYITYLNAPDAQPIIDLFDWRQDSGGQLFTYRKSGSLLYYSTGGTGNWTVCGNGTLTVGSHVGHTVLNNTLVISQYAGTTRHSTNGTSFIDTSLAPAGEALEQYQNRVYMSGTDSTLFYSVTGDPTNWSTTGTSDSSSLTVPGAGNISKLFKLADRLFVTKQFRSLFRWDGFSLVDTASNLAPSSPYSYGSVENNGFWLNEKGIFTSAGDAPQLISNPIYRFFQNDIGSAITGAALGTAPATIHYYDYLAAVGSMTDDFTNETVPNAIIKYNFQKNEFLNWTFADFPTAIHSYRDITGLPQLIFGNATGQTFQVQGTAMSDNGKPIEAIIEMMFDFGNPLLEKEWRVLWAFFNPGCSAQVSVATSDTFIKDNKRWQVIGDGREGAMVYRFRNGERSRFLYVKITENSTITPFNLYGIGLDADTIPTP